MRLSSKQTRIDIKEADWADTERNMVMTMLLPDTSICQTMQRCLKFMEVGKQMRDESQVVDEEIVPVSLLVLKDII